jgi:hypothetical protein
MKKGGIVALVLFGVLLLLGGAIWLYRGVDQPSPSINTPIVVLIPPHLIEQEAFQVLQRQGVFVTDDETALRTQVARVQVEAVLIHRDAINDLDVAWVRSQYRAGIVMTGIDIEPAQMRALLGLPPNTYQLPPFVKSPYILYLYNRSRPLMSHTGGGVLQLSDFDQFISFIESIRFSP